MASDPQPSGQEAAPRVSWPRLLGRLTRGAFIGGLLVFALIELYAQIGNLTAFKYVGF